MLYRRYVFHLMNDMVGYIRTRYDYLLITTNKTKTDIFNELNKIIL